MNVLKDKNMNTLVIELREDKNKHWDEIKKAV